MVTATEVDSTDSEVVRGDSEDVSEVGLGLAEVTVGVVPSVELGVVSAVVLSADDMLVGVGLELEVDPVPTTCRLFLGRTPSGIASA